MLNASVGLDPALGKNTSTLDPPQAPSNRHDPGGGVLNTDDSSNVTHTPYTPSINQSRTPANVSTTGNTTGHQTGET